MSNANYFDVAVFIILIIEFFIGMRSGVLLLVSDILSLVLGWFAAKAFALKFAIFLDEKFRLASKFAQSISSFLHLPSDLSQLPATIQNLGLVLSKINLPDFLKNFILRDFSQSTLTVNEFISQKLASWSLNGLAFVIIFVSVLLIVRIVGLLIRRAIKVSPFLKWIDTIFGGVFKVLIAAIVLAVIAQAIVYVFSFFNITQNTFVGQILNSRFYVLSVKLLPAMTKSLTTILSGTR